MREDLYVEYITAMRLGNEKKMSEMILRGFRPDRTELIELVRKNVDIRELVFNRTITVFLDTGHRTGHVYAELPVYEAARDRIVKKTIGFYPEQEGIPDSFFAKGVLKDEKIETGRALEKLNRIQVSLPLTEEAYIRLGHWNAVKQRKIDDYVLHRNNCATFVDQALKASGYEDGLVDKFDPRAIENMDLSPIRLYMMKFFRFDKMHPCEQRFLVRPETSGISLPLLQQKARDQRAKANEATYLNFMNVVYDHMMNSVYEHMAKPYENYCQGISSMFLSAKNLNIFTFNADRDANLRFGAVDFDRDVPYHRRWTFGSWGSTQRAVTPVNRFDGWNLLDLPFKDELDIQLTKSVRPFKRLSLTLQGDIEDSAPRRDFGVIADPVHPISHLMRFSLPVHEQLRKYSSLPGKSENMKACETKRKMKVKARIDNNQAYHPSGYSFGIQRSFHGCDYKQPVCADFSFPHSKNVKQAHVDRVASGKRIV